MSDTKRHLESKDPEPVAKALAGTLEPPVLNHRPRRKRQKVQGEDTEKRNSTFLRLLRPLLYQEDLQSCRIHVGP